jgi:hypothetical protein
MKLGKGGVRSQLVVTAAVAIAALHAPSAMAAAKTWTGGGADGNWSTVANWAGAVAPAAGDDLMFPAGAARLSNNNDLGAGTSFNSIAFTGPVGGYTLAGNAISLVAGITAANSGLNTLSFPVTLTASQTFSSDGDRLILDTIALGANTLTLNTTATGVVEVDGAISGSGGVIASGQSVVFFNAPCTYAGPTNVTGGFFGAVSLNVASVVTVSGGGELDYANGNSTGPVIVNTGGKISCGGGITQIGNLTNLTMTPGTRLTMIIYGISNFGQLDASGAVDLGGATLVIGGSSNTGDSFLILNKTSAGPVTGIFAGLPEGALFSNGSRIYKITYMGGDGNDVVVTDQGAAPPEEGPSIPTLGIAGVAALAAFLALAGLWLLRRLPA